MAVYGSKYCRIYHSRFCGNYRKIKKENLVEFSSKKDALKKGYAPAQCCHSSRRFAGFKKTFGIKEMEIARENGIGLISVEKSCLTLESSSGRWKILWNKDIRTYKLYHRNTDGVDKGGDVPGYHNQHKGSKTLAGVLRHIAEHDEWDGINRAKHKHKNKGRRAYAARKRQERERLFRK